MLDPKNPTRRKFILNTVFNYSRKIQQLEKRQQIYFGKKEGEALPAIINIVIDDAENLGLVPMLELTSDNYGSGACQLQQSVWHSNLQ